MSGNRVAVCLLGCMLTAIFLCSCGIEKKDEGKIRDLDYTVVCEEQLPESLLAEIREKKSEPFELNYSDGNFTYLVRGYGEQPTGGYSIRVLEVYLGVDGIVFHTELLGPEKEEASPAVISTPFVVIKTEMIENTQSENRTEGNEQVE